MGMIPGKQNGGRIDVKCEKQWLMDKSQLVCCFSKRYVCDPCMKKKRANTLDAVQHMYKMVINYDNNNKDKHKHSFYQLNTAQHLAISCLSSSFAVRSYHLLIVSFFLFSVNILSFSSHFRLRSLSVSAVCVSAPRIVLYA